MNHLTALRARAPAQAPLAHPPGDAPPAACPWRTYGDLWREVGRAAAWLRDEGVGPDDVVVLRMTGLADAAPLHLAAIALGAVSAPASAHATADELALLVDDARPRLLVADPDASRWPTRGAAPAVDRADDDLAMLIYTSGTTGRPKGVRVRHGQLAAALDALHVAWAWRPDDVLLHALPLHHVHGLVVALHGALWAGARVLRHERFDADAAAEALTRGGVTVFMGVPTMHRRLLASPALGPLPGVRLVTSGSAPLSADDHRRFAARTGAHIVERYGMTEAMIVLSNPIDGPRVPGSVGRPLPGVTLRIVDDAGRDVAPEEHGELVLRGPTLTDGYHGRLHEDGDLWRDGWMRTGDVGYARPDGYVVLVGRRGDVIITGGYNVHPVEVEAVIARAAGVGEVGVVGLPDADLGERLVAAVVPGEGWRGSAEVYDALGAALSRYKHPRDLFVLDALPRNAMGKLDRRALRARLEAMCA